MRFHRHVFLIVSGCLSLGVQAEMYSWKDSAGKLHYGDRPPVERQKDARVIVVSEPADAEMSRKAFRDRQMSEREQQQKDREDDQKRSLAKEREENCQQARANLKAIESGQVAATINSRGERVAIEGAVRDAEVARARQSVDAWCRPPGR